MHTHVRNGDGRNNDYATDERMLQNSLWYTGRTHGQTVDQTHCYAKNMSWHLDQG